tara:strand:- start:540 stop:1121 length:582 start_codon:yes stop_codon:yes gene_type:complete
MDQYNMILPDTNKIYFETNPKNVALKVFRKLNKNKINQSRIIFENNSTKKKYEYIAMTNNKLDYYKKLNSIQSGGSNLSNDQEFLNQLNKISSDLELTFGEFKKIISSKIEPEPSDDIFVKVVDQLDKLDNKVEVLSKQFNLTPTNKNASTSISDSIKNIENNIEQIIDIQKNTNEKIAEVKEENKSNYCTIS